MNDDSFSNIALVKSPYLNSFPLAKSRLLLFGNDLQCGKAHFRTVDSENFPFPVRRNARESTLCGHFTIFFSLYFSDFFNFFNFLLILRHTRVLRGSVCLSYFLLSSDKNKYCVHTLSRGSRI